MGYWDAGGSKWSETGFLIPYCQKGEGARRDLKPKLFKRQELTGAS